MLSLTTHNNNDTISVYSKMSSTTFILNNKNFDGMDKVHQQYITKYLFFKGNQTEIDKRKACKTQPYHAIAENKIPPTKRLLPCQTKSTEKANLQLQEQRRPQLIVKKIEIF